MATDNMETNDTTSKVPSDQKIHTHTKNDRNRARSNKQHANKRDRGGRLGKRAWEDRARDNEKEGEEEKTSDGEQPNHTDWRELKKRRKTKTNNEPSFMNIQFPQAEIAAEERRPKRKVAVMIGYSGTGYHGLQINHSLKTIEGDLFAAFVAANAIAKVNADDPKKTSFVRCARTDKGVHAGGNMVSLKLIIEDPDIVSKINEHLPPQIRVWGIERTNNNFNCHQSCDSRWYEYLIPSYCLLPPHPESYLGKEVLQSVKEHGLEEDYARRLGSVKDYWDDVEKNDIQPLLNKLEPGVRDAVVARLWSSSVKPATEGSEIKEATMAERDLSREQPELNNDSTMVPLPADSTNAEATDGQAATVETAAGEGAELETKVISPVMKAFRECRVAYVAAKRRYRVTPDRLDQLQEGLDHFVGTKNYHNYTILKTFNDPSAKRNIRSFIVDRTPIQYEDTEWLSMKVHGQSFMMHQIRKMVGMAALVTRCATPLERFKQSFSAARISIPKAPSLGLLLERPQFEAYNKRARDSLGLKELDYSKFDEEIKKFKAEFIYRHIYELEEKENSFHTFFHQVDSFKSDYFLWVTAGGIKVAHQRMGPREAIPKELEDQLGDDGALDVDEDEG
ncbi:pseudouridine synthase [Xylariaceae sp. FL0255]|nr:pseudouridine synthase [Xylariaceae sp. FL0255]